MLYLPVLLLVSHPGRAVAPATLQLSLKFTRKMITDGDFDDFGCPLYRLTYIMILRHIVIFMAEKEVVYLQAENAHLINSSRLKYLFVQISKRRFFAKYRRFAVNLRRRGDLWMAGSEMGLPRTPQRFKREWKQNKGVLRVLQFATEALAHTEKTSNQWTSRRKKPPTVTNPLFP